MLAPDPFLLTLPASIRILRSLSVQESRSARKDARRDATERMSHDQPAYPRQPPSKKRLVARRCGLCRSLTVCRVHGAHLPTAEP